MEPNCLISPQRQKLLGLLVKELCEVLPVKVCGQWNASSTIGQLYLETKISVLAFEYQKKISACLYFCSCKYNKSTILFLEFKSKIRPYHNTSG